MIQIRNCILSIIAAALLGVWVVFFEIGIHAHLTFGLTGICMTIVSIKSWLTSNKE
ncbi:MAG: hypothetical protein ACJA0K_001514 [Maricaulis maris]|jgi:hypothetical protein